jgi:hypothetical protein
MEIPTSRWWLLISAGTLFALGFSFSASHHDPSEMNREHKIVSASAIAHQKLQIKNEPGLRREKFAGKFIYDRSPVNAGLLISKNRSRTFQHDSDTFGDLWFQDAKGNERIIARNVVHAKFSPDGKKIAYSTSSSELFVETLQRELLAQVPRASDPDWREDSAAVSFRVVPSSDYTDMEQIVVYELQSGRISQLTNGN